MGKSRVGAWSRQENLLALQLATWLTSRRFGRKTIAVYKGSARTVTAEKTVDAAGKLAAADGPRACPVLRNFWCSKVLRRSNDVPGQELRQLLPSRDLNSSPLRSILRRSALNSRR